MISDISHDARISDRVIHDLQDHDVERISLAAVVFENSSFI
jgi:hypothetical protein